MNRYIERFRSHHDSSKGLKDAYTTKINKEEYLSKLLDTESTRDRVLYIHVPFCNKICSFCPFNKPPEVKRSTYDDYLIKQIDDIKNYTYMKAPFKAVNFGGGTPTTLKPPQMDRVLKYIHNSFEIAEDAEISLETTITELTDEMIEVFVKNGVNRLSIGVQSFNDETREMFNRRGSGEAAIKTIRKVIDAGIVNTSIDLIYNSPKQTVDVLEKDLEIIAGLGLAGISFYSLRIHEKTPLYSMLTKEDIVEMNDVENEKKLFMKVLDYLRPYGYEILELTKLVRNGLDQYKYVKVRHNEGECIPLGHGSGGNIGSYLCRNVATQPYVSEDVKIPSMGRVVEDEYLILDKLVYQMQTSKVDLEYFSNKLNRDLKSVLEGLLNELEADELIVQNETGFVMTDLGVFWGNNIINEVITKLLEYRAKTL